jgi:hypothetical protein
MKPKRKFSWYGARKSGAPAGISSAKEDDVRGFD